MKQRLKIKGIVFDLGGVLIEDIGDGFAEYASKKLKIKPEKLKRYIHKEGIEMLGKGKETSLEFWHRACNKLKLECPSDKILKTFWVMPYKHAKIKKEMIGLVKELRKNYKLAILSNTIKDHSQINRKRKLFDYFDEVLLSNEVGFRKPEKEFFKEASKRLGIQRKNLIFIDNEMRWIKAAKKYGLNTILFKDRKQLEIALKKKGVN